MTHPANHLSPVAVDRLARIMREDEEPPPPVHAGYEIGGVVARGGMGTIYRAFERKLQRSVAMKVLDDDTGELCVRFEREARCTADLQHPNIVPVFDLGTLDDGRPFYTMKLVEGQSLRELVGIMHRSAEPCRHLRPYLRFVCQVCDALDYAHRRGVIHRDLKPGNIMIGEFHQVWLLDWGLVRMERPAQSGARVPKGEIDQARDAHSTKSGTVLGTPAYMAPEALRGAPGAWSVRADVYAVGAILFEILAGRAPFDGVAPDRIIDLLASSELPGLETGDMPIPRPLRSIVQRAMAPDPADRYPSAGDIADDLRRWMDGLPVLAHAEHAWEWLLRLGRRHVAAIAVIVCYLLVRISVLTIFKR